MHVEPQSWRVPATRYTESSCLARTSDGMKSKPDPSDSSLSETMAARIEINELGDPAHQKKITDAGPSVRRHNRNQNGERRTARLVRSIGNDRKENRASYPLYRDHDQDCGHRHGRRASRPATAECTGFSPQCGPTFRIGWRRAFPPFPARRRSYRRANECQSKLSSPLPANATNARACARLELLRRAKRSLQSQGK
jgi:hypothetical protein